jgi:hypothetical protein
MPLHTVTESDSFDTNVQMPADGDGADSSDLESSTIAPLTNRTRWLKNALEVLQAFLNGGALTLAENLTYTIASGKILEITGQQLRLNDVLTRVAGKVVGHLFTAGQEGVANKKTLYVGSGAGDFQVYVYGYDTVIVSGTSGLRTALLMPDNLVDGHHVRLVNESTAQFLNYQPNGGSPFGNSLRSSTGNMFAVDLVWKAADSAWHVTGYSPFDP